MTIVSSEPTHENVTDQYPLLLEQHNSQVNEEHVIDVEIGGDASSSDSTDFEYSPYVSRNYGDRVVNSIQASLSGPSPSSSNSRNSRFWRSERIDQHSWSPFKSRLWISIELVITLCQIIASTIVVYFSRHEHPRAPLFAWVVGYTAGCLTSLPIFYWRFRYCNQGAFHDPSQASEQNNQRSASRAIYGGRTGGITDTRIGIVMNYIKMALNCFFAAWFIMGNVWIFGGHASADDAPNLYRLCIAYLTLSCIGYAAPLILCATICCCLPCIISFLRTREDSYHVRGASEESINALPTYRFKVKKEDGVDAEKHNGIVVKGSEVCFISGEDTVCCICLSRYTDGNKLRELPCSHFFHTECVDKWLKINSTCPLCKDDITPTETEAASSCEN